MLGDCAHFFGLWVSIVVPETMTIISMNTNMLATRILYILIIYICISISLCSITSPELYDYELKFESSSPSVLNIEYKTSQPNDANNLLEYVADCRVHLYDYNHIKSYLTLDNNNNNKIM